MTRGEIERRLLVFVRGLPRRDGETGAAARIGPETRLFEDRIVDSLRVLDLLAFLEDAIGERVPDAAVRIETFRSVRAIATAFGSDGDPAGMDPAVDPARPVRIFRRRAGGPRLGSPVEALDARGELALEPPGRASFRGAAAGLPRFFDAVARSWARELGARELAVPDRLPFATLARAGCPGEPAGGAVVPPAACYHAYREREGARLEASALLTMRGRCFRDEPFVDLAAGRLRAFEMREVLLLGERDEVEALRGAMIERTAGLVRELDLEGRLEVASDPFFLQGRDGEARGRRLVQRVLPLKLELRLPLHAHDAGAAVASFNHHLDFFGRRFRIRLASGATAHSGCAAFGLERWTLAFLARHGTDPSGWPAAVRESLAGEARHAGNA